jgi:DNA-binding NarL/FixJ family response regulator
MNRVPVYISASDPICLAGLASQLRPRPEVLVLDESERDRADVGIVASDAVDEEALQSLRTLKRGGVPWLVAVCGRVDESDLASIMDVGVAGIVRRSEATPDRLVAVIAAAAKGEGTVPPDLLGRLLSQVGQLQRQILAPMGMRLCGMSDREIEVVRLVAEGLDTVEIASKLSYSERTIKNILHDITSRLHLRNRAHAVAYALRNGLI